MDVGFKKGVLTCFRLVLTFARHLKNSFMYSSSEFEKLWFHYKTEGEPSSDSLMKASPAPVCGEVVLKQSTSRMASVHILVTIQTCDSLDIRKSNLN